MDRRHLPTPRQRLDCCLIKNTFLKLTSADQLDAYVEVNRAIGLTWNLEVRNSIFELKLEFMAS
jgi:hypothetical protein